MQAPRRDFEGLLIFGLLVLCGPLQISATDEPNEIIKTESKNLTGVPIIIETQVPQYDEPNLREYTECHLARDTCLKVCESHENVAACEAECIQCPILINHDLLVQGVNDTEYREPAVRPVNTTNVINITNEIRNVIDNTKNITALNENNVHIHQSNATTTGGKFGLGYNDNGPCCNVVRESGKCAKEKKQNCNYKKQRVCGQRCKAREMYAKRVSICQPDDTNEGEESCREGFRYVPYRQHQKHASHGTSSCQYVPSWPYVHCGRQQQQPSRAYCQRCMSVPYGYILRNGMPSRCSSCYRQRSVARPMYTPYMGLYGPVISPVFDEPAGDWGSDFAGKGWNLDKVKCRLPDGSISEDCYVDDKAINELPNVPEDPLEILPEAQDENYDGNDFDSFPSDKLYPDDDYMDVDAVRRRRQIFQRSSYSHRSD